MKNANTIHTNTSARNTPSVVTQQKRQSIIKQRQQQKKSNIVSVKLEHPIISNSQSFNQHHFYNSSA